MTGNQKLMLQLAAALPKEEILKKLKESISKYDNSYSESSKEESFNEIEFCCTLLMTKRIVPNLSRVEEISNEIDGLEKMFRFMKSDNNQN